MGVCVCVYVCVYVCVRACVGEGKRYSGKNQGKINPKITKKKIPIFTGIRTQRPLFLTRSNNRLIRGINYPADPISGM